MAALDRGLRFEVEGGRQLRKSMREAGVDLAELKEANRDAAKIAASASADLAPVRTGRLQKSIRGAGTKTAGVIRAGNNTRAPYGGPIHWGWFRRHITPQPFLSQGARDSEGRWRPIYERHLDDVIDRIKGD